MTSSVLNSFLELMRWVARMPTGVVLLRHVFDCILFNHHLWIHTAVQVGVMWNISVLIACVKIIFNFKYKDN